MEPQTLDRKSFLKTGGILLAGSLAGSALLSSCSNNDEKEESATEDLMKEHGLLNRILVIYDECIMRLANKQDFSPEALHQSAGIIRRFVEDYHEKQEEDSVFPRFRKAGKLVDLVDTLQRQHDAGRTLTSRIIQWATAQALKDDTQRTQLMDALRTFNYMYRPHESREDTILFPELKKIISSHEFDAMGEDFEKREQKIFGQDGFEKMVSQVADIEKNLGIDDLNRYTPKV